MLHLLAAIGLIPHAPIASTVGLDDFPPDLGKWIEVDPPELGSDDHHVANNDSTHEWVVSLQDGRPRARLRVPKDETPDALLFGIEPGQANEGLYGRRTSVEVSDGWIVGFNAGEFGAGLWWFSTDGKDRYKISEEQINGFIPTDAGLLALEGLAHGSRSTGRLLRLARGPGGRWESEILVDLQPAPRVAVKADDGSLIVATTDRLLRIVPATKKVEILVDGVFWGGLYPNSMATTPAGVTYLGMRHGVAKVERQGGTHRLRWLLPNRAFVEMEFEEGFK